MIGIIGAMKPEIDGIKGMIENRRTEILSGIEFVCGNVGEAEIVAAQSGIGKVFAAVCTQTMILKYKPELIINVGVGGTLTEKLGVGDIAIASAVVQHDMDTSPLGDPVGWLSGLDTVEIPCHAETVKKLCECVTELGIKSEIGIIATGDQFIGNRAQKDKLKDNFNAIVCEMEGGSVGQVCRLNGVDFCVVRAVSDGANDTAALDYPAFMTMAAENSTKVMRKFFAR